MRVAIQQGDSLPKLALKYGLTADQLAQVNSLEYPFISPDPNYQKGYPATGNVTVTLTQTSALTLPIGTVFKTSSGNANEVRSYATTQQVTLTAQGQSATVPVSCTINGNFGNVLANTVTVSTVSGVSVNNASPISGGRIMRVLIPGDFLIVPETNLQPNNTPRQTLTEYDAQGGTDFYRTSTGGLAWGTDDLLTVTGAQVVGQDIGAAIVTPIGSDPDNTVFGTPIASALALGGDLAMHRIAVLGQGAANTDSRVSSVGAVTITPDSTNGTYVKYAMDVTLNNGQQASVTAQVG